MRIERALRLAAVALAVIGIVDPSLPLTRAVRPSIELQADLGHADDVGRRLVERLEGNVAFNGPDEPVARVLIGDRAQENTLASARIPVSTVSLSTDSVPNVRIVSVSVPQRVPVGWTAKIDVRIAGRGVRGTTSRVALEQGGVELSRIEHKWTLDREVANVVAKYAPPVSGATPVTVRVTSTVAEADDTDNSSEIVLRASDRQLRVLAYEPRPSWSAAFIRRALEQNAAFDVTALVRPSRGIEVTAGVPPAALTADSLRAFDAVLVGAPEELRASEVDALRGFIRVRGGSVILVPDRRPSGPFLQLVPSDIFDEVLLENPTEIKGAEGTLLAGELAIPRSDPAGSLVFAALTMKGAVHPVVFASRIGEGQVIFSGALDAWRFRASANDGFAQFWTTRVGEAALAAPQRVEVKVAPSVAAPGDDMAVQVRVRPTEFVASPDTTRVSFVSARIVGPGVDRAIRLWPSAEVGVFEGRVVAPAPGTYDLQVRSADATADMALISADRARTPARGTIAERDRLQLISNATGGISATADDLSALIEHLRGLGTVTRGETVHPSRSLWFVLAFVGLVCAEWALRRRRGLA